ncbi:hypothetical protein Tco_1516614 [Tanacetum coccineum]
MTTKAQQSTLDNVLVAPENQRVIGKCNMRINPRMKPKEPTYQAALDTLALTTCYPAFLIITEIKYITDVIVDHLHQPWRTFASIINKCLCGKELAYQIDNKDSKKQDKMFYPRFTKIIIHHFLKKDKSILMRNRTFMHTAQDDSLLGTMRFISRHEDTQVYGAILPKSMTNQAMMDSIAYKTYYAIALGAEPPKSKKPKTKSNSAISSEETPSKKKPTKAKKDVPSKKKPDYKPKPTNKKAPVKANRGKDEGIGAKPGVPNVPKYDSKSNKESLGDSREEKDDDEDDTEDDEEDDEENEEELTNGEELYKDVNVNLRKEDVEMTDADQGGADQHNVSQKSGFEQEEEDAHLLNFENVSSANNEIASLMDTTVLHEEPSGQTSTLFIVPITVIPTHIPPPPHFFNPLPQQATPAPTPATSEATTLFTTLLDFLFVFKFNDRVTKLETDLSEIKQVEQYAQAISSIPAIIDHYINNKLREAIHKAIQLHNAECREEAQAKKQEYIDLVDTLVRTIIKEEVKTQLPQILPKAVSNFSTPVIERMKLYDALVESYNTEKDLFNTYGEVFTLKRSQDDKDKDQDPSAGSDRGTKRRKSSKEAESLKDQRSKEGKSSTSSKGSSHSHHKSSGKSAHVEEPSHTVDDSVVQKNQEFDTSNNDEQPDDEADSKNDWFKKPERPLNLNPNWNKRQYVDLRPAQTWISITACAEKPPTSFDELIDTLIDFSKFVMNRLNITNLTKKLLVGLAFSHLKGTYNTLCFQVIDDVNKSAMYFL